MEKLTNFCFFLQEDDDTLLNFANKYIERYKTIYSVLGINNFFCIPAGNGYIKNMEARDDFLNKEGAVVFTNSIYFLSNDYFWDHNRNYPTIYMVKPGDHKVIRNIQAMTPKTLRFAHNIRRMFLAGEFQDFETTVHAYFEEEE